MQTIVKKEMLKGIFSILIALTLFAGIIPLYPVKMNETAAAEDYHTWRQMDPRWGNVDMNGTTVARSGCLITSLSIMAMASDSLDDTAISNLGISSADNFNPGVLADAYRNRGGFSYGGAIASWGTIHQIIPQITFIKDAYFSSYTQSGIAAEIKEMMDQGIHVIVNVNWHWVYIEGVIGDDIYMIDPASDTVLLYDEYQLSGGNEYWAMTCKNPPSAFIPPDQQTTTTTSTTTTSTSTAATTTSTTTTSTSTAATTTSTTTTSTSTAATTTSTTTTSTSIAATTTTIMPAGEYFNPGDAAVNIYGTPDCTGEPLASVRTGEIVNAAECTGTIGHITGANDFAGWIDLSGMTLIKEEKPHEKGDINSDGKIDMYDLGLLGEYLKSLAFMPDGVSILTACEAKAADINGDGKVTNADVLVFLTLVCD